MELCPYCKSDLLMLNPWKLLECEFNVWKHHQEQFLNLAFFVQRLPGCPLIGLAIAREELQKTILQLRDFDLLIQVVHLA